MASAFTPSHRGGAGPPLVCLHGFTDTWRTWELVLAELERHHEVLAPTLAGHAGGPALPAGEVSDAGLADAVERAMDDAGFDTAHIVGTSLGGYVALTPGRPGTGAVGGPLAPAGGWAQGDDSHQETLEFFAAMQDHLSAAAPHAEAIAASAQGRRRAPQYITTNYEHIPPELVAHLIHGAASCEAALPLISYAIGEGYRLAAERVTCPVRIVWGTDDRILPWPSAATRYRGDWLPHSDWVELEGVGHCPQLDVPLEAAPLIVGFTAPPPRRRDPAGSP